MNQIKRYNELNFYNYCLLLCFSANE